MRFLLGPLKSDTKSIVLELTGDPGSSEESFAYWASGSLHLLSHVKNEELDPTKQTIFQNVFRSQLWATG